MNEQIKASDLRIGNWVQYKGRTDIVVGIFDHHVYFDGSDEDYEIEFITGISLSNEVLVESGVVLHKDKNGIFYFKKGLLYYLWVTDHFVISYLDSDGTYVDIHAPRIYHLHQLQNIIFDLTNTELKIEL